jgi:hypothetical protein
MKKINILSLTMLLMTVSLIAACENKTLPLKPAEFNVYNLNTNPLEAKPSENITISAVIGNTGQITGNYEVVLKIDGLEKARQSKLIQASENITVSFTVIESNVGKHEVEIASEKSYFSIYEPKVDYDIKNPVTIQYDNKGEGIPNDIYTGIFISGKEGHLVWFSAPSYPFKLTGISISGSAVAKGYGPLEDKFFTVTIWDKKSGNKIWSDNYSWQIFDGGIYQLAGWKEITVPEIVVKNDFYVEIVTHSEPAPLQQEGEGTYVASSSTMVLDFETTKVNTRSWVSLNGVPETNYTWKGNWYIRATGYVPLR